MLQTKYDFEFSIEDTQRNIRRLTNQLWKLIPMRENEEDWVKQLESVIIEITGLNEVFVKPHLLQQLLSKLEGIKVCDISFETYRRTVFESISLLQEFCRERRV